ncbi:unnamed protein product [Heligmosomoides polygyrus]|uniref:Endo/exonuclease/phosphatase domain-containing protein n=1 Tax=Heligmosomoides polygyrus TaxID=6339 RepID=A0A3P8H2G2_HELPZ|nr:unnamed protein product [Heligmosomoides polygyrus]
MRDSIVSVERFDDRLMKIAVAAKKRLFHFFSALLDEKTTEVPLRDAIIVAGDLNVHEGAATDGYSCHGGFGYGCLVTDAKIVPYEAVAPASSANHHFKDRATEAEAGRAMRRSTNHVVANGREGSRCDFSRTVTVDETATTVGETWRRATDVTQAATSKLGITKPGRRKVDKQA